MKKILFLILLATIWNVTLAQDSNNHKDTRPLVNLNLNVFGDASVFSINFERQIVLNHTLILSTKLGLGYNQEFLIFDDDPEQYFTLPHHLTLNIGKTRHFFEVGIGGTLMPGNIFHPYVLYPIVGYRILPLRTKKINFRVFGEVPVSGYDNVNVIFVPFGLSIGISL
ncbi:MAG: hypothetical protein C0593_04690 [Marinilabiliales bacterium]|nr:MAG: hypothetical protein C0593_04690 [Marinilabiliales bacterium]